ncbi:MAG: hypothetical protein SFX18_19390 [Pirellulales bacterium]|nr:hypothetical protein [Pirellulales bacterium]
MRFQRKNLPLASFGPLLVVAISVFASCYGTAIMAQQQQPPKTETMETEITIQGIKGNICQAMIGEKPWLLQIDPKLTVEVIGTAEVDFLPLVQAPLMLRFKAEVHKKKMEATEPVSAFEVINISERDKPGIIDDSPPSLDEPKKGPPPQTVPVIVQGPVTGLKNGILQVGKVKIKVDPAAVIELNLTDPRALALLPPATPLTCKIEYYPGMDGRGILKDVKVKLAEPLAAPKKPMPKKPASAKDKAKNKGKDPEPTAEEKPDSDKKPANEEKTAETEKPGDEPTEEKE